MKALARGIAALLVVPPYVLYRISACAIGPEKAFPGWSQAFGLLPGLSGVYLRRAFYRRVLPRCGADCCLSFGTVFSHPTAEVGRRVYSGVYCSLGDITLEDDVMLGSHVSIVNGGAQHGIERIDLPIREQPGQWPRIIIGRDTWIGDRAVILADIGAHCAIGAGAVVTKVIPDYAVAVGVPARVIRYRHGGGGSPPGTEPPAPIGAQHARRRD